MNREQKLKIASAKPSPTLDAELFNEEIAKIHAKFSDMQELTLKLIESIGESDDTDLKQEYERITELNNNLVKVISALETNSKNDDVLQAIKSLAEKELPDYPEIPEFPSKIKVSNPTTIPTWLAKNSTITATNNKLESILKAVKDTAPKDHGQTPGDFLPIRRVRMDGRTLKFDDGYWGGAAGGGGGSNQVTAKQGSVSWMPAA